MGLFWNRKEQAGDVELFEPEVRRWILDFKDTTLDSGSCHKMFEMMSRMMVGLQLCSANATDHYNNTFTGKFRDSGNGRKLKNLSLFLMTHSKTFHPDGITLGTTPNGTTGMFRVRHLTKTLKTDATVCCDALHNQT